MFTVLAYSDKFSKCFGPFPEMENVVAWLNLQSNEVKYEIFDLITPDYTDPKPLSSSQPVQEHKSDMIILIGKGKYLTHCYGPFKGYSKLIEWLNAHYAANAEHYQGEHLYRCLELINPYEQNNV
ncbi:hypothetical protein [Laspinema olomoucense]|uniref:hypothetical protein n=1 Tax=Laspinema olomoucense TaxID=3231600 RepID=UPI0021BA7667|nr:hypothetical protein [Laspinema sp. D3c]MCT7992418.1 hypothetical protein [Laspinema sp. D3c]